MCTWPGTCGCWHSQSLALPKPGTAKAWHCHVPAPRARGTCVVTSRALLHLWHPGISGSQRGEEPSSMCSQLPFGHHFATNGSAACLVGAGVTRITSRRAGTTYSRMLSSSHHSLISLSHCAGCCSSHLNGGREKNFNSATKRWLLLLPSLLPAPAVPVSAVCWAWRCGDKMLPAGGNIPQRVNGARLPLGMGAGGWVVLGCCGSTVPPSLPSCTPLPDLSVWECSSPALSSSSSPGRGWEGSGHVPIFPGGYTSYPCSNTHCSWGRDPADIWFMFCCHSELSLWSIIEPNVLNKL